MTGVRMTAAEAKRLGVDVSALPSAPAAAKRKRTRKTAGGSIDHICVMCGERFKGRGADAAESRHVERTGHPRFALVLAVSPDAAQGSPTGGDPHAITEDGTHHGYQEDRNQ